MTNRKRELIWTWIGIATFVIAVAYDNNWFNTTINYIVEDFFTKSLYEDRREDDRLIPGLIEVAIKDGIISVDEITEFFRSKLEKNIQN